MYLPKRDLATSRTEAPSKDMWLAEIPNHKDLYGGCRYVLEGTPALDQPSVNSVHLMLSTPCSKKLPFQGIQLVSVTSAKRPESMSLYPSEARPKASRSPAED